MLALHSYNVEMIAAIFAHLYCCVEHGAAQYIFLFCHRLTKEKRLLYHAAPLQCKEVCKNGHFHLDLVPVESKLSENCEEVRTCQQVSSCMLSRDQLLSMAVAGLPAVLLIGWQSLFWHWC